MIGFNYACYFYNSYLLFPCEDVFIMGRELLHRGSNYFFFKKKKQSRSCHYDHLEKEHCYLQLKIWSRRTHKTLLNQSNLAFAWKYGRYRNGWKFSRLQLCLLSWSVFSPLSYALSLDKWIILQILIRCRYW